MGKRPREPTSRVNHDLKRKKSCHNFPCLSGSISLRFDAFDCSSLIKFPEGLKKRFETDGVLFFKSLIRSDLVKAFREVLFEEICDFITCQEEIRYDSVEGPHPSLLNSWSLQRSTKLTKIVESEDLVNVMRILLGDPEPLQVTRYRWLRAVPRGKFTGVHIDKVYMRAEKPITVWIPLADVSPEHGALCWIPGSHKDVEIRELLGDYLNRSSNGTSSGWFSEDVSTLTLPSGRHWTTTNFKEGDVVIFNMNILHHTLPNQLPRYRLSCETRWTGPNVEENARLGPLESVLIAKSVDYD